MVVIELFLGFHQISLDILPLAPGQRQQPVEIVAHNRRFRRHRRHLAQLLHLGFRLGARFMAQRRIGNLLVKFGQLVALAAFPAGIAQLALDRLHLLIEIIFALGLFHLPLDAVFDLPLHLQHTHLAFHQREHLLEAVLHLRHLQQFLLVGELHRQVRRHLVGKPAGISQLADRGYRFGRDLAVELYVILELLLHGAHQRLHIGARGIGFRNGLDLGLEIFGPVVQRHELCARAPLHQHLHGAIGQLQQLQDRRQRAGRVQIAGHGIVDGRILLGHQHDLIVGLVDHLERPHGLVAAHKQRRNHVRENNDVPKRQHRHCLGLWHLQVPPLIRAPLSSDPYTLSCHIGPYWGDTRNVETHP